MRGHELPRSLNIHGHRELHGFSREQSHVQYDQADVAQAEGSRYPLRVPIRSTCLLPLACQSRPRKKDVPGANVAVDYFCVLVRRPMRYRKNTS